MIHFTLLRTRFSISPLTLLLPLLSRCLDVTPPLADLTFALGVHELAHLHAARLVRVGIQEIRLLPFGGSARMENPYGLAAWRLIVVSMAGPVVNLLCATFFAALAQWKLLAVPVAARHVRIHLLLMAFNLLPALPLDGGRTLYALLQRRLGRVQAMQLGVALGRLLAAGLSAIPLIAWFETGRLNLVPLMTAIFIVASAQDERDALYASEAKNLTSSLDDPLPVRIYQLSGDAHVSDATRLLRPGEACWFVLTKNGEPRSLLDNARLLEFLRSGGRSDAALRTLSCLSFIPEHRNLPFRELPAREITP